MLGQLQDAGNTVTLARYLDLLNGACFLYDIYKYAEQMTRCKASSPKPQVYNNALISKVDGRGPDEARRDPEYWGKLVESAVGAHLVNAAAEGHGNVYWRQNGHEVDFVLQIRRNLVAIEVKSGRSKKALSGMRAFLAQYRPSVCLLVGEGGLSLEQFFSRPLEEWVS